MYEHDTFPADDSASQCACAQDIIVLFTFVDVMLLTVTSGPTRPRLVLWVLAASRQILYIWFPLAGSSLHWCSLRGSRLCLAWASIFGAACGSFGEGGV